MHDTHTLTDDAHGCVRCGACECHSPDGAAGACLALRDDPPAPTPAQADALRAALAASPDPVDAVVRAGWVPGPAAVEQPDDV